MAPGPPGKRKRGDRSYSGDSRDEGTRPSPHRPNDLSLGQRMQQPPQQPQAYGRGGFNDRARGYRRGSRGGSYGGQRNPLQNPENTMQQAQQPAGPAKQEVAQSQDSLSQREQLEVPQTDKTPMNPVETAQEEVGQTVEEEERLRARDYAFELLTNEILEQWQESGREHLVYIGRQFRQQDDDISLVKLFQELIEAAVQGRVTSEDAGQLINDVSRTEEQPDPSEQDRNHAGSSSLNVSSLFLDMLSIYAETSPITSPLITLVQHSGIEPAMMRRELDSTLLESLGMIRNTFVRVGIRQQTNLLYRQSNYNLLREETEGYSKLVTEFFTTSSNEPPTSEIVEETFEQVKGMIGAFDLDVGRVLDITLDVFAAVLVKQYRFFVKYLRASSWWPTQPQTKLVSDHAVLGPLPRWALPGIQGGTTTNEERQNAARLRDARDGAFWRRCRKTGLAAFFEIGGRSADSNELSAALNAARSEGDDDDVKWIEITNTLPPLGNKVAAQILGFKLRFYCSAARDASDVLPVNLIYLAALLIKVGFISLRDVYSHIWPEDSEMDGIKEQKMKEKAEREKLARPGGGGSNALLAAAPLPDDTVDGQAREVSRLRDVETARRRQKVEPSTDKPGDSMDNEQIIPDLPEPAEQKVQLLKSLLCIGALPEAMYMLGRFPWLPDAFPELPEYIHRILHHCLRKVYEPVRPLQAEVGLTEQQRISSAEQGGITKGHVKLIDAPTRKTMRWAQLDKDDTNEAIDYRFYWDDWADIIPVCQTVDDVFTLCSTLLNFSGVKIGQDPVLLLKLARIGSHSIRHDNSLTNMSRWTDLSKRLLVPALSLTKCNPGVVNEVFELIKHFPDQVRYNIYGEWYFGATSRLADIKAAFDQTRAETRDVLKRISKTTIKPMARALAKVTYASPGVVFSVAISQLESYDNIVDTFVECGRYFTYLAYDVLTWSLMSQLGGSGRNRIQSDGLLTSKWLAALSLFAGKVFKRYSVMNPLPVVQYVSDQLRKGSYADLLVLENITRSMAGIISDSSFNEGQILAMGGGEVLQSQTLQQLLDRRHESKSTARRLIKPLLDSQVAGQVLISLAQERQMCIFRVEDDDAHPKLLGNVFDQIHRVLGQYLDFLRSNLSIKDFGHFVPNVIQLIIDFGVEASVAFWISRPSINAAIQDYDLANLKALANDKPLSTDVAEDVSTTEADKLIADPNDTAVIVEPSTDSDITMNESLKAAVEEAKAASDAVHDNVVNGSGITVPACHPILQDIADVISPALPSETWKYLTPAFFTTFWQLSLGDVFTSLDPYQDAQKRLGRSIKAIADDRSDVSVAGQQKKAKQQQALNDVITSLQKEMKECMQTNIACKARLRKEKDQWFPKVMDGYERLNVALIEHCLFPRLIMSPLDAMYTFKMIKLLHAEDVANFRTLDIYDQFFAEKRLTSMIFLCSAKEAECLGRFLNDILRDLGLWHAKKETFEKEAYGVKRNLSGFTKGLPDVKKEDVQFYDYEEFRRILLKWHRNLNNALKTCYASSEYMHIRNAINILNNVHQHFPAINWMGSNQMAAIVDLSKNETRTDLKIAATSLIGALKKREKSWALPQAFNIIEGGQAVSTGGKSEVAKSSKASSAEASKALNPEAPDFKPSALVLDDSTASKATRRPEDEEDGEIEDLQMSNTNGAAIPDGVTDGQNEASDVVPAPKVTSVDAQVSADATKTQQSDKGGTDSVKAASVTDKVESNKNTFASTLPKPAPIPQRPEISRVSSNTASSQSGLPNRPAGLPPRHPTRAASRAENRAPPANSRESRNQGRGGYDGQRDLLPLPGSDRPSAGSVPSKPVEDRHGRLEHVDHGRREDAKNSLVTLPGEKGKVEPNHRTTTAISAQKTDLLSLSAPVVAAAHPDRAALIESDTRSRYSSDIKHTNPERRSRASSQTRLDGHASRHGHQSYHDDPGRDAGDRAPQSRYDDSHAPKGPRNDRDNLPPPAERFRENLRGQGLMPVNDAVQSRSWSERPSHRQSESYGRLNDDNDVASTATHSRGMPTDQGSNHRSFSAQSGPSNSPYNDSRASIAQPPKGPAPSGPAVRSSPRNRPSTAPQSHQANVAPIKAIESAVIHPDRLKAIQGSEVPTTASRPSANSSLSTQPALAANTTRGPPTGPSDRGRGVKSIDQSQNGAAESDGPNGTDRNNAANDVSIRGRGGRSSVGHPSSSLSNPPPPSTSRQDGYNSHREELFNKPENRQAGIPFYDESHDGRPSRSTRRAPLPAETYPPTADLHGPDRSTGRPPRVQSSGRDLPPPREDPRDRFRNPESGDLHYNGPRGNGVEGSGAGTGKFRGPSGSDHRAGYNNNMNHGSFPPPGGSSVPAHDREMRSRGPGNGPSMDRRENEGTEYNRRGDDRDYRRDDGGSLRKRGRPGDDGGYNNMNNNNSNSMGNGGGGGGGGGINERGGGEGKRMRR